MTAATITPAMKAAVEAALAKWRRTGAFEDGAVFHERAHAAVAAWTPPDASSERTFHRAWLRAVDDPVGRGWAVTTLLQEIPGADPIQQACALAKRLDALARHAPDPRFRLAVIRVRNSDAALGVPRLRVALARLDAIAEPETDGPVRRVTEFPPATPEITALWQAVRAQPDDDGALAVLADALQGIGDPRGELIALQLAAGDGGDDTARLERARALIASCGAAWLGRLAPITGAASFERGVLRRWQLHCDRPPSDASWAALVEDPGLATVTDLVSTSYFMNFSPEVYTRFVTSPAMRSLVRVDVFDRASVAALARAAPSLRHVACVVPGDESPADALAPTLDAFLDELGRHRGVTSVAIPESLLGRLAAARWFHRLTAVTLGVGSRMRRGLAWWAELPAGMQLTLVPEARLPACATSYPWDFGVALTREGRATVARLTGEWLLLPLYLLTALPADVERVEVDHPAAAMVERVREALARPGVEIVHRPEPRRAVAFVPTHRDLHLAR